MCSKVTLALGTALAEIALFCFVESSPAQDALAASIAASDNDDVDGDDTGSKDEKSRIRRSHKNGVAVNADHASWANGENRSLAVTSIAEIAEAEAVVVTGSFDTYPVHTPRCRQLKERELMPARKLHS